MLNNIKIWIIRLMLVSALALILIINFSFSQSVVTLLEGKVTEEGSNQAIGTAIRFINQSGKNTRCLSNAGDGSFQQILTPGETYFVAMENYMIMGADQIVTVPQSSHYTEIQKSFKVKRLTEGMDLFTFSAFESGQASISKSSNDYFLQLKNFAHLNPKVNFKFVVANESAKKIQKKSGKKSKSNDAAPLSDLTSSRIESLKQYLQDNGFAIRHHKIETSNLGQSKPQKDSKKKSKVPTQISQGSPNLKIVIDKILDL